MAELSNMEFPLQIKRQYAGPIDTTEIFTSLAAAQSYASTGATKYVGQIIQVVEGGKAKAYIIQNDGSLTEVGAATATDGYSIELVEGKLQLKNFQTATQEGMQLWTKLVDGHMTVEWRKPDSTTIEGLTQRVVTLEGQMATKVENNKIAGADLGLIRSQDDGSVGAVVVDPEQGTAKVEKVQDAVNAETATNATQLNGHADTYFAKQSDMDTAKGNISGLQTDVSGLKDGTVPAKKAELADKATKLAASHNFSATGDATAEPVAFDGTQDVALNLILAEVLRGGGSGCKVTVDSKGRVTAVEALAASDIPNLTHEKITDLGTAALKDVGTAAGQVVVVAADGKIDAALMPAIAITAIKTVANQEAMLALQDVQIGDIAIRTDENKSYILTAEDPSQIGSWTWLRTPDCKVLSVNGKTGAVVLTTDDVSEGSTNQYFTAGRFTTEFAKHASTELTDTATLLRSTDTLILDGGTVDTE